MIPIGSIFSGETLAVNRVLGWVLLTVALGGCGGAEKLNRAAVAGAVSLDGQPLESGSIQFVPDANQGPTAGASIAGGRYSVEQSKGPMVGKNRVQIRGSRKTGKQIRDRLTGQMVDDLVEVVPAKYRDDPAFTVEVKSGENVLDFTLKSK